MQPGTGMSNGSPQSNQDLANAEPVPMIFTWASDQLMNEEHHDALSS